MPTLEELLERIRAPEPTSSSTLERQSQLLSILRTAGARGSPLGGPGGALGTTSYGSGLTTVPNAYSGPRAEGVLRVFPIRGGANFDDTFGAPRPDGRTHAGQDLFADAGTPVFSPVRGVARRADNSLGGISVIVEQPDGSYAYLAHLQSATIPEGGSVEVRPGDPIGRVGNTGNAVGTPHHVHFEYHPGGGSAINPIDILNAALQARAGRGGRPAPPPAEAPSGTRSRRKPRRTRAASFR